MSVFTVCMPNVVTISGGRFDADAFPEKLSGTALRY
jgi:hypothetical protein